MELVFDATAGKKDSFGKFVRCSSAVLRRTKGSHGDAMEIQRFPHGSRLAVGNLIGDGAHAIRKLSSTVSGVRAKSLELPLSQTLHLS